MSCFEHACAYVEMKWQRAAAKSRKSMSVARLRDLATLRSVLDALSRRIDGGPAAATTMYRKRAVFYNALGYAVERKLLPTNPIDQVQWSAPEVAETVDRRVVTSPAQVKLILAAVRSQGDRGAHLYAYFAVLCTSRLRPSEAVALRGHNCVLPQSGWGRLDLTTSEPCAGQSWTNERGARDERASSTGQLTRCAACRSRQHSSAFFANTSIATEWKESTGYSKVAAVAPCRRPPTRRCGEPHGR